MSLNKAIRHGKEKRKPYRGAKAFCRSCRPGGSCGRCQGDRTFQGRKVVPADLKEQLEPKDE